MKSETTGNLDKALAYAQSEFLPVSKDTQGFNYKYAPLESYYAATRPALLKYELTVVQMPSVGLAHDMLVTKLSHWPSNEFYECAFTIRPLEGTKNLNALQELGATITYYRRYAYCTILGIIGEKEDSDGVLNVKKPRSHDEHFAYLQKQLMYLCKANNIKPKEFAEHFNITSSDKDSVINAVENFEEMKARFQKTNLDKRRLVE